MIDVEKLKRACEICLAHEKRECAVYGTASTSGERVAVLLEALGLGTLEEWTRSEEWKTLRASVWQ